MEKFDYIILTENNRWLSTGKGETQKELDDEIKNLMMSDQTNYGKEKLIIFKAPVMEAIHVTIPN